MRMSAAWRLGQTVDHSAAVRHAGGKAKNHLHTTAYGKPRRQLGSALFSSPPLLPLFVLLLTVFGPT